MDIKSKNSRRAGIIVVVILLSICSLIMMSQYDGMKYAMDSANSEATEDAEAPAPYESALGSISHDLACWMSTDREILTGRKDILIMKSLTVTGNSS